MYRYETHLHTSGGSACAKYDAETNLRYYKAQGYDGVFVTNHYIDGNSTFNRIQPPLPYMEKVRLFFEECDKAKEIGKALGIAVFEGLELSHSGTDFLVYGLPREWYFEHPEANVLEVPKTTLLPMLMKAGALVIQAHPFREACYIDHIRLFPRCVHGVEVLNTCRTDFENRMAKQYAESYGLLETAGTDNHHAHEKRELTGMQFSYPIESEQHFVEAVKRSDGEIFSLLAT